MTPLPAVIRPPPEPRFDVRTYGAKGDAKTMDTAAIQRAIDACAGTGGSVVLEKGWFLTQPLVLKAKMTFYVAADSRLIGTTERADYPVVMPVTPVVGVANELCRSLLFADQAHGLVIDGGGVIDGQCKAPSAFTKGLKEADRPSLLRIFASDDVIVRNIAFENPRMWTQIYSGCRRLTIDHVRVDAHGVPNQDGLDVCDSSDVVITNNRIFSDDDSICLKTHDPAVGLRNIRIENNVIHNTGANAFKLGTATFGPVSGIRIRNNTVYRAAYAGLAIESVDGSAVSDVVVSGLDLYQVSQPVFIRLASRRQPPGSMTGVVIERLRALAPNRQTRPSNSISGILAARIGTVRISDAYIEMPGGLKGVPAMPPDLPTVYPQSNLFNNTPAHGFFVRQADQVVFERLTVACLAPDARPWLKTDAATVETLESRGVMVASGADVAPRLTCPATAAGKVGTPFTYRITATNSPLDFAAANLPAGLAADPVTGQITGIPVAAGTTTVTIAAASPLGKRTMEVVLTVAP